MLIRFSSYADITIAQILLTAVTTPESYLGKESVITERRELDTNPPISSDPNTTTSSTTSQLIYNLSILKHKNAILYD